MFDLLSEFFDTSICIFTLILRIIRLFSSSVVILFGDLVEHTDLAVKLLNRLLAWVNILLMSSWLLTHVLGFFLSCTMHTISILAFIYLVQTHFSQKIALHFCTRVNFADIFRFCLMFFISIFAVLTIKDLNIRVNKLYISISRKVSCTFLGEVVGLFISHFVNRLENSRRWESLYQ